MRRNHLLQFLPSPLTKASSSLELPFQVLLEKGDVSLLESPLSTHLARRDPVGASERVDEVRAHIEFDCSLSAGQERVVEFPLRHLSTPCLQPFGNHLRQAALFLTRRVTIVNRVLKPCPLVDGSFRGAAGFFRRGTFKGRASRARFGLSVQGRTAFRTWWSRALQSDRTDAASASGSLRSSAGAVLAFAQKDEEDSRGPCEFDARSILQSLPVNPLHLWPWLAPSSFS